ncbi:LCP family protein [Sinomonas sp. ASV486]|uniref:LCP family protein n=1 Tax=Sinomonas sp. ASV486 TaxID=3051170 RepID=UPI0027DD2DE3|nr:LCP family protein [Sinomonas sp. ASV486]MDQ4490195.1 LCP family protein [Sinomonas sp. ASV486]
MGEQARGTGRRFAPRRRRWPKVLAIVAIVVTLAAAGSAVYVAQLAARFNGNVRRSDALSRALTEQSASPSASAVPKLSKDTNVLIMGLDSRLDENGNPLPQDIQDALHAGDDSVGFYNANVLMLVHIPADGSQSTAVSIPRDDYVQTAGFPGAGFMAKVKEAYSYGFAAEQSTLLAQGKPNDDATYQSARDAGRAAEIATVSQFLGGVQIDHFVEITMVAFYQVALAIQPITVCVNRATQDTFSGADFRAGMQQINAQQAMSFVRQRRDTSDLTYNFTDLDRSRRQQAFIASVLHQLKQAGTLTDLPKMEAVLDAVSKNMAIDRGLDLLEFSQQASSLTGGNISFTTLPILGFGTSPEGASINLVDVGQIRATVRDLLAPKPPQPTTPPPAIPTPAPSTPAASASASSESGGEASSGGTDSTGAAAPSSSLSPDAASTTASPAPTTYADWQGPLQGGGIPCVK